MYEKLKGADHYTVRFNLGRGDNFRKWQIKSYNSRGKMLGQIHLDPNEHMLTMINATLHNKRKVAEKIFAGSNKSVCAWVRCDKMYFTKRMLDETPEYWKLLNKFAVRYNPRVNPFWEFKGHDVDGQTFDKLYSTKNLIYASNSDFLKVPQKIFNRRELS